MDENPNQAPYDFNFIRRLFLPIVSDSPSGQLDPSTLQDCKRLLKLIDAMTDSERSNCDLLLDLTSRERIARDSEESIADVNELISQRQALATMLSRMDRG